MDLLTCPMEVKNLAINDGPAGSSMPIVSILNMCLFILVTFHLYVWIDVIG